MNVSELYALTQWIKKEIEAAQVQQKYQQLQSILQQHSQNQRQNPIEPDKDALLEILSSVPLGQLTRDQYSFLVNLGIADLVGDEGVNAVEDLLFKNVIDVATSAQKLQTMTQQVAKGIQKSNQILEGLTGCVPEEAYEVDHEVLMRVTFTGNAGMNNVKDFKSWGSTWYDIARGVAMAHGASPEDVHVIGATKGSIVIELATVATIAGTVSGIILAALKVADKVMDIRKKAEEIRGLKLQNDKLAGDLEKAAETEKKDGIEQISISISADLNLKSDGDGDKITALKKSVKNLVDFVEKGGVVDFVAPEADGDEESGDKHAELRLSFEEIRQLEKKLHLIERQ